MSDDDDFFLDDDAPETAAGGSGNEPWNVLVVDDEPDVHDVTRLALKGFSFLARSLRIHSARSAAEAMEIMGQQQKIALILLDVVMETDHAGLDFARWLRDERGNLETRIILRTGQPGQAPERQVVLAYDINDYKSKADLTADRLFASVVTALRGYHEIEENARLRAELLRQMSVQSEAERDLVDMLPFPVFQVDPSGQFTAVNDAFAVLLGLGLPEAVLGQFHDDLLDDGVCRALVAASETRSASPVMVKGERYHLLSRGFGPEGVASGGAVACLVPAAGRG